MNGKIKCLLVDNEQLNLDIIETFIHKVEYLELIGTCENAFEAIDFLQSNKVDLLFSDIQMPKVSGIELVSSLPNPPAIIFVTAFDKYALKGFDVGAVDYLLKPISFDRFFKACNKAKNYIEQREQKELSNKSKQSLYMFIKENDKLTKVLFSDILYIEAMGDYVKIITNTSKLITYSTLKGFEKRLLPHEFVRTHKSFIVQINAIKSLMGNTVNFANGDSIPISKNYKDNFHAVVGSGK
jgi:DNA-binding LytR/AlgR family response regulator